MDVWNQAGRQTDRHKISLLQAVQVGIRLMQMGQPARLTGNKPGKACKFVFDSSAAGGPWPGERGRQTDRQTDRQTGRTGYTGSAGLKLHGAVLLMDRHTNLGSKVMHAVNRRADRQTVNTEPDVQLNGSGEQTVNWLSPVLRVSAEGGWL
jgi:hypothetical protein